MAFVITITAGGQTIDYTKIVDHSTIKITEHINMPTSLAFSLYNLGGSSFVAPVQRAYVRIYSPVTDRSVFTGYITSEPNRAYVAVAEPAIGQFQDLLPGIKLPPQLFRYDIICTSDEYLLNVKAVPFIPAFVNRTQGQILSSIANVLAPGFFDTSNVASGDLVPYFTYDPKQSWSEIAKQFADGSRYRYSARDKQLFFTPYNDQPLGVVYDEENPFSLFAPHDLASTVLAVPLVNDVTIIGDAEAGANREDYFIGDGFTGNFPLRHKVFRGATSLLLQETWANNSLNTQNWFLQDPFSNFNFAGGALNVITGVTPIGPLGTAFLQMNNGIELAGGIDLEHAEVTFNDYCHGVIGGVYTDVQFTQAELLGGFFISTTGAFGTTASGAFGIQIQPQWSGSMGPVVVTKANHTYVLQTVITAPKYSRYDRIYRTVEGEVFGGVSKQMVGSVTFYIQDFDIAAATGLFYQPTITTFSVNEVPMPPFATYGLVNNVRLNVTIDNTTVAIMPYGGLKAYVGPSGLIFPTGAILPMLPPDASGFVGVVQPYNGPSAAQILPPPLPLINWETEVLGNGLGLQKAQITAGNDVDTLGFYVQTIPAAGTPIRLQTWASQAAVSRLQDKNSIANEAFVVGDDGLRSAIVTDLNPLPRTSEDCDNAGLAYLRDRTKVFYNGTYNCTSLAFHGLTSDTQFWPCPGRFLQVNAPHRGIVHQKFLIVDLQITMLSMADELMQFSFSFGADLYLEKVLKHFVDLAPVGVLTTQDKANPPNPRFTINVNNSFLPDISALRASKIKAGFVNITVDESFSYPIEVRTLDANWGRATLDYVGTFFTPGFTLNRQQFDQQWFMRYSSATGTFTGPTGNIVPSGTIYSRRSKAVRVRYPMKPSPPIFVSSRPVTDIGPSGQPINSFAMQLAFNGDQRSIYGFELRAADNETVIYQIPALSAASLGIDIGAQTAMPFLNPPLNTEFSLYAYFFNHQWEYSDPLIIGAQLLTGTRLPYIWSPGFTGIKAGEACTNRASFGIKPFYTTDASGTGVAYAKIEGVPVTNLSSVLIGEPVLTAVSRGGGFLPSGTYLVGASARDNISASGFGVSPLDIVVVNVNSSGAITVNVEFNQFGTDIFVATPDTGHGWFFNQTLGPGVLTGTIFGPLPPFVQYGAPDPICNNLQWDIRRIWHGGIIGVQVAASGVTSGTLTLAGANFGLSASGLVGRYFSLLAHFNQNLDIDYANFKIAAATTGTNTVITVGPGLDGVTPDLTQTFQPLDVITVRILPVSVTPTSFSEPFFLNSLNLGPTNSPTSITSSGTTATVTLPNHGFKTGQSIQVSGATQAPYNGTFQIIVIDVNTFTYIMTTSTTSPATGTLNVQTIGGIVGQEIGRLVWIIYGTGSTQAKPYRTVVGNDSFNFQLDTAWDVLPDATSVLIFVNANTEPQVPTQTLHVKNQFTYKGMVGLINVENLANVPWFFRGFTQDVNGNGIENDFLPFREIWVFGQPGVPTSFGATFVFPTSSIVVNQSTNAVKNQSGGPAIPVEIDISAITASTTGATTFQIETSPDLVTWTSILSADVSLPINQNLAGPLLGSGTFAPGAAWPANYWIRARPTSGTATDAQSVTVQLKCATST